VETVDLARVKARAGGAPSGDSLRPVGEAAVKYAAIVPGPVRQEAEPDPV